MAMTGVFKATCQVCGECTDALEDLGTLLDYKEVIVWLREGKKVEYITRGVVSVGCCRCTLQIVRKEALDNRFRS